VAERAGYWSSLARQDSGHLLAGRRAQQQRTAQARAARFIFQHFLGLPDYAEMMLKSKTDAEKLC
jgi:hypothetical protein